MIAIIDFGINNLASVRNAVRAVGADAVVTADPAVIAKADKAILPGIGAAAQGMKSIHARGLAAPIAEVAKSGRPLLGICLGMQLLFEWSEEGGIPCLGLLPGRVQLLSGAIKVPHMGWNQVETRSSSSLWEGMDAAPYFYFVHSFICEPADSTIAAGVTTYGRRWCSAVTKGSVWGTQFHPERSGGNGLALIQNFVRTRAT